jgi:hypothetical protein
MGGMMTDTDTTKKNATFAPHTCTMRQQGTTLGKCDAYVLPQKPHTHGGAHTHEGHCVYL